MINLVESIQTNLGYAKMHKVDPNTQDIGEQDKTFGTQSLSEAAIPAVLIGLFNYVLEPGRESFPTDTKNVKWLPLLFGDRLPEMTRRIAAYAGTSVVSAKGEMEHIADEAVRLLMENQVTNRDITALRKFAMENKRDTLLYLPEALHTGELLGNNTLDDSTHKMQGPISGMMHAFEKHFGGDGSK